MPKPTYIALTALESHWGEPENTRFLTEGCKDRNKKQAWEQYNPETLDNILWDSEELRKATPYCNELGFKLIKQIAPLLEEKYKQNLSEQTYEKILSGWTLFFAGSLYVGYKTIKSAIALIEDPVFITCDTNQSHPVTYSAWEFIQEMLYSDTFNLYIYSDLIKCMGLKEKILPLTLPSMYSLTSPEKKCSWKKQFLINLLYAGNKLIGRPYHVITDSCAYSQKELVIKSKGKIIVDNLCNFPIISAKLDEELRQQDLLFSEDDFSQIVGKMAMKYIPWGLAEGMVEHVQAAKKHNISRAKSFFSSTGPWINLPWIYAVALSQKPVGVITHGGDHSIYDASQATTMEDTVADVMFDSGPGPNSLPNPRLYILDMPKPQQVDPHILFLGVSQTTTIYTHQIGGFLGSRSFLEYNRRRLEFFKLLNLDLPVIFRRFFYNANDDELLDVYPSLSFQRHQDIPFAQALSNTKIFVSDACWGSLTITESLTARKPSVLVWHKDFCPVTKRMEEVVAVLADAKIVHYNVQTAAAHLNEVHSNPDAWWQEAKTQKALDFYIENFAIPIDNWQEKWLSAILAMG